jgi:uroporphyrinogen decarboxylase
MFGFDLLPPELSPDKIYTLSEKELDIAIGTAVERTIDVYERLGYSIIPLNGIENERFWSKQSTEIFYRYIRAMKKQVNDKLLAFHGDGTFAIPDGDYMYEFAYRMADDPDGLLADAQKEADFAIERNKRLMDCGVEVLLLCSDYCYNTGPFLSPGNFAIFIQPFLAKIIEEGRKNGQYAIKHTDGNIMPILNMLADCNPHALHSLDPMAGVDIAEVKRRIGDRICLIGNVNCALLQTGTDDEIRASAEYAVKHGKPNGGYIFSTSNVPFKGLDYRKYEVALGVWRESRKY